MLEPAALMDTVVASGADVVDADAVVLRSDDAGDVRA